MAEASRVVGTAHCMHNRCSIPVAVVEVHFLRLQNTHDIPQCYTVNTGPWLAALQTWPVVVLVESLSL